MYIIKVDDIFYVILFIYLINIWENAHKKIQIKFTLICKNIMTNLKSQSLLLDFMQGQIMCNKYFMKCKK